MDQPQEQDQHWFGDMEEEGQTILGKVPYPQVIKDVANKRDVADPGLERAGAQFIPVLVLLLKSVEEAPAKDTLASLFALRL